MAARSKLTDVRRLIIAEATRLFAERGFDGTSIQAIATAVGISKPSLLYHFPSKDELRCAVLRGMVDHWNEALPRLLAAASADGGQSDAVLREMIRFAAGDPYIARLLVREVLDRGEELTPLFERHVVPWIAVTSEHLRRGQEAGHIHAELDPELFAREMIILVICSVAAAHCSEILAPVNYSTDGEAPELRFAELLRIARTSLLSQPGAGSRDRPIPPRRKPARDDSGETAHADSGEPA